MGVEQIVRDARIAQIYEGANGIQALDWLVAKSSEMAAILKELFDVLRGLTRPCQQPVEEAFAGFSGSPIQWSLEAMKTPTCPVQYRPITSTCWGRRCAHGLGA